MMLVCVRKGDLVSVNGHETKAEVLGTCDGKVMTRFEGTSEIFELEGVKFVETKANEG
jgi:hypothetical protein